MNVVDLVEAARPEVAPMPLADRRMVRERLFGAADDVVRTTIRERSSSGAVTSTAPAGYRASRVSARPSRPRASGSLAKMGAGLLVVGAAAAAGWSWLADGDDGDISSAPSSAPASSSTTTSTIAATTTTVAPTRTGVTSSEPVVFPLGLVPIEEAVVDVAPLAGQYALLRAADGSWLRLETVEGGVFDPGVLDFDTIGSIDVAPFAFGDGQPWIYTVETNCGALRLVDAPAQDQFRPTILEFLEGVSVDDGGSVDALLPPGVRIVEASEGMLEYRTVFRFDDTGDTGDDGGSGDLVTLRQVPQGSLAQLIPGGVQPSEMIWLGEGALGVGDLDPSDDQTGPVTVFWRDGATVFSISSETVGVMQLETFVSGLRAASTDDWIDRFSATEVDTTFTVETAPPDDDAPATTEPPCSPQPRLGPTFRP